MILRDVIREALEHLPEGKLAEVFDFVSFLLAKEGRERIEETRELDPEKDPILREYIGGVSVEPFAHKIDDILYGEED